MFNRLLPAVILCVAASAWAGELRFDTDHISNIFAADQPVQIKFVIHPKAEGAGEMTAAVTDYFGASIAKKRETFDAKPKTTTAFAYDLGVLPVGYYEVVVAYKVGDDDATLTSSFGVAPLVRRTAAEARAAGSRFGIKYWSRPWFKAPEKMGLCADMGMQWTREIFSGDIDVLAEQRFNIVMKVERFPAECYDDERYPPIDKWHRAKDVRYKWRQRKNGWVIASVPKEAEYKAYVRQVVRQMPTDQNVFEIWNEPWNKMKPDDFAKICTWSIDAVLAERPNAIVGPNGGAKYGYDQAVAEAGALKRANMVAIHPYTREHPENKVTGGFRQFMRERRAAYESWIGRPIDIYVTEFGWPTPPAGDRAYMTERKQAQWTVRHALALCAEDVKGFMPHVLGQLEKNPEDHEDWFGFFRRNGDPKPVVLAYAACARLIDSSNFVGDLDLGVKVGAMLFERGGVYTLALWTSDESRDVEIDLGVKSIIIADVMGREQTIKVGSPMRLTLTGDVTYLIGVSAKLADRIVPFDPMKWPVDEFLETDNNGDGEPDQGRAKLHWPPRETPEDMRWLEATRSQ